MRLQIVLLVAIGGIGMTSRGWAQPSSPVSLQKVLTNTQIWGKDFSTALADVAAMHKVGQSQVSVFESKVETASGGKFGTLHLNVSEFQQALSSVSAADKAAVHEMLNCKGASKPSCSSPVLTASQHAEQTEEHNSVTIAASAQKLQFLRPGASIDTVRTQLGNPEQVTREVIQTKYERRPTILTKYQYASGAVIFATSNLKPNGEIDRVILNADEVSKALASEPK